MKKYTCILLLINLVLGVIRQGEANLPPVFRLIALDVGEGQAIILQSVNRGILIDTGHAGKVPYVLQQLRHYGIQYLDYIVLTHLHPDHASGYFRIRESFPDTSVLVHNFIFTETIKVPDMSRWVGEALSMDSRRRQFRAGDSLEWQGASFRSLWPHSRGENMNHSSLVIEVIFNDKRVLLMGDVGVRVEQFLIDNELLSGSYEILVAGHHGSNNTSSELFLKQVNPAYSIVSTNADNIRGYPSPKTIDRLARHTRLRLFKTFEDGDICLELNELSETARLCGQDIK